MAPARACSCCTNHTRLHPAHGAAALLLPLVAGTGCPCCSTYTLHMMHARASVGPLGLANPDWLVHAIGLSSTEDGRAWRSDQRCCRNLGHGQLLADFPQLPGSLQRPHARARPAPSAAGMTAAHACAGRTPSTLISVPVGTAIHSSSPLCRKPGCARSRVCSCHSTYW
jgi:hypothetical protein